MNPFKFFLPILIKQPCQRRRPLVLHRCQNELGRSCRLTAFKVVVHSAARSGFVSEKSSSESPVTLMIAYTVLDPGEVLPSSTWFIAPTETPVRFANSRSEHLLRKRHS